LIVGLGNPGSDYKSNRHNVGQQVLDVVASGHGAVFKTHKSLALVAQAKTTSGESLLLVKSTGFMNLSGGPVAAVAKFYSVPTEKIIVIHDELDFEFGDIRRKFDGGHAGHNGLRDISAKSGSGYHRVRFGIGRPPGSMPVASFVLQDFSTSQKKEIPVLLELAADHVLEILHPESK
jgi:PTH1 family peptidyl-tRNA hydrolase